MNPDIAALLDCCNVLIASALAQIERDTPDKHKALLQFVEAGATPRLTIETHSDLTTVGLALVGANETVAVFEFRSKRTEATLQ